MSYNIGIIGATGITGEVALRILAERALPVGELRVFASERSAGRVILWRDRKLGLETLSEKRLRGLHVVLNATDSAIAREWAPRCVEAGAVFIDKSSAFRQAPDVPLVIPEINAHAIARHKGIIASPNCTTATVLMAVAPLHKAVGIRTIISSSYQSVSGVGRDSVVELIEEMRRAVVQVDGSGGHEPLELPRPQTYPHNLAFNVFPQCETFPSDDDSSTEEAKMGPEIRKVLEAPDMVVEATAVRVPVIVGHAVSLTISLEREISPGEAREIIDAFPGSKVVDNPQLREYPTPQQSAGIDDVLVGRIRRSAALPNGLSLFAAGDNLRKGASLNAIQIAENVLGFRSVKKASALDAGASSAAR